MHAPPPAARGRKVSGRFAAAGRAIGPAISRMGGKEYFVPLLLLFWFIFYQNLPDEIHGVTIKPLSTAGSIDRTVKLGMIAISFIIMAVRWSVTSKYLRHVNPGLVAFMVLIPVSAAWSIDSSATILRYTTLLSMVLLCLAIPLAGWDRQRIQQLTLPPLLLILVVSLLVGVVSPDTVKEIGDDLSLKNAWRGITHQKNQFGVMSSLAAIMCLHKLLAPGKRQAWAFVGLGIALLCLALSRSSTSLLATMLVCTFMVMMFKVPLFKDRFSTLLAVGIFSLILIYAMAVQNLIPGMGKLLAPVMHLTGKDMTFSSRSIIWDVVKQHSAASPWVGSGYAAFWIETPSSPSYVFVYLMNFYPTSSHNGYLEVMNDLGRVGLVCLLAYLIFFLRHALQLMPHDRGQAVLYLALLYQQMVDNLSESEWFSRTATCTILILASACLSRALVDARRAPLPAAPGRRR